MWYRKKPEIRDQFSGLIDITQFTEIRSLGSTRLSLNLLSGAKIFQLKA